ncbi:thioredoxin, putative [Entamoeba invadens IP1]|uniref:Thioredoxin, putative n=1 Tax=Entamoeba invadens IP1 TaxID=370355 RepID=A0A0A1UCL0_ENTIV|nr:thioredoxin, putative [Entamoeba invadens IP1]ELP93653.1 thioredoxin, putative [Entamoeba invadens IP1]|eukprot:XP_004260424.1 thioredoxin, putative [Entamoeba invadens IP1]
MLEITTIAELDKIFTEHHKVCVKFFATWCPSCQKALPIALEIEKELPDVFFVAVDTDKASEVFDKYEIQKMPNFLYFIDGVLKGQYLGNIKDRIKYIFSDPLLFIFTLFKIRRIQIKITQFIFNQIILLIN